MCFDVDSTPPIPAIHGGEVDHRHVELVADDGNRFLAFEASGGEVGVVILPDVRGLYRFYEELALRFAERGMDALAIDYFGRTAGVATRDDDFDFWPEVRATTIEGVTADVRAAVTHLRRADADRPVFVIGFCFGGSNSWHMAASGMDLTGAVGFYGHPDRPDFPQGAPSVMSRIADMDCPVLALQGGNDPGIPTEVDDAFSESMAALEVDGEVVVYDGAPHSFFDRKQDDFTDASDDAWRRVQAFIERNS